MPESPVPNGCYFKLHVIPPPRPLGWESPRALLLDTLYHHLLQDSAPIGHFYIEVKGARPNAHGVSHFLTGMSRTDRLKTTLGVMKARVGLGTFFYDFPGTLDRGSDAARQLGKYQRGDRLKSVRVPLSPERADLLFDELHQWIRHGSFRHYGGGHRILKGEGSGCADMGAHFLRLALDCDAIPKEWIREVYGDFELIGNVSEGKRVGLLRVLQEGRQWASGPDQGRLYSTPDMELTWAWLEWFAPGKSEVLLTPDQAAWSKGPAPRIQFEAGYPLESEETVHQVWDRVRASG
jgi:hypothetical protein